MTRAMAKPDAPLFGGRKPPLALIAGPTASGKSAFAVGLAQALENTGQSAAIINSDSAQVYADLTVLSARPSEDEMTGVPHHLFGTWDGAQACSAADWAAEAKRVIAELHGAHVVPILVGGTGMYLQTLLDGIAPIPPIDPAIRSEVRAMPQDEAYAALTQEDPQSAAALAPADAARTTRALEVVRSTGKSIRDWRQEKVGGIGEEVDLRAAVLLPDRGWLYERCDRRFAQMFDEGAVEEVRELLARDLDPALPVMRAIGVREIASYLSGGCSREEAIAAGAQATRNYAKRQYTWFRRQPPASWTRAAPPDFKTDAMKEILFPDLSR
ncbi:tRNA (adenosine(37)-N6)-dimethylallyltransferase MiaA [Qipengyuania atrilutea]|uniref:tRNA dimethylallyltransferase n=1 Tax=Qipengyuania atrilutea TaxID=2744473 RepID=A0A850GZ97_9SPHN|nr:tRNA (adenosine(37)-N6)-dimethylallyltransferase MiaA [Actirhodobacter atriluteus]NVD43717.1 tRNA (adenosine(37)-N6)-dimethylallyltransferase MiaA [Actirhodobacter atriluteus]